MQPDLRNLGGLHSIVSRQSNHILALINSKPRVHSLHQPRPHVNKGKPKLPVYDMTEVNLMQRRVSSIQKGKVDNNAPFQLKSNIKTYSREFREKINHREHLMNVYSLNCKLSQIGRQGDSHRQKSSQYINMLD